MKSVGVTLLILIPISISCIALVTGILGLRRAQSLPQRTGRTPSMLGVFSGGFTLLVWVILLVLSLFA